MPSPSTPPNAPAERSAPVSALALGVPKMAAFAGRSISDLSPQSLAGLIHFRLGLQRAQGWAVFGAFAAAFAGIYALSGHLRSELLLGSYAAAVACLAATSATVVERSGRLVFVGRARREGMSEEAARLLYDRAKNAGPLVDVLRTLNREPQVDDLLRFVDDERRPPTAG